MNRIRLAHSGDGGRLAEIYRPAVEDSFLSLEDVAPDGTEMSERIAQVLRRTPWVVAEGDERVTGFAYASRHRERPAYSWTVEVSIYVDLTLHRAGVGRRLYATLFDILLLQGFHSVVAGIVQPNLVSTGFHQSMGFTEVGMYRNVAYKSGRWCNTVWHQRPLSAHPVPPAPVHSLAELTRDPRLLRILDEAVW